MQKTYMAKPNEIQRNWWLIDAQDIVVGRLAVIVADILRGKNKATFTPHLDCGDHVVIVNADKVKFTGKKFHKKRYYWHTGYPGGIKETSPRRILEGQFPERVLQKAVFGMISRGPLQRDILKKLHIYSGPEHKHNGQNPQIFDVAAKNTKNSVRDTN